MRIPFTLISFWIASASVIFAHQICMAGDIEGAKYAPQNQPPKYPKESLENSEEGTVILIVNVTKDGVARDISVKKSSGFPRLDEAAISAVTNWKFDPAKENGVPTSQIYELPITFKTPNDKQANDARQKAIAERKAHEEKRRQWLESPEGKKFQAEEAAKAKRLEEQQAKTLAKEFPFFAVITCGLGDHHMTILGCFTDYGSMEIRNGDEYGLYKIYHIANRKIPNSLEERTGLILNLRRNFEISAQNGDEDLILGVKIYERSSGKIIFQKQVSRFRVINVRH
jgi:TonB family protein